MNAMIDRITLTQGLRATDAHIVASLLQSGGVDAVVDGANVSRMLNFLDPSGGQCAVTVPAAQHAQALAMWQAYQRGEFALPGNHDEQ